MTIKIDHTSAFVGSVLFNLGHLRIELDVLLTSPVEYKQLPETDDVSPGVIRFQDEIAQVVGEIVASVFKIDFSMAFGHQQTGKKGTELIPSLFDLCAAGSIFFVNRGDN